MLHDPRTLSAARLPPQKSARQASLTYATYDAPGIRRKAGRDGFIYISPRGPELRNR